MHLLNEMLQSNQLKQINASHFGEGRRGEEREETGGKKNIREEARWTLEWKWENRRNTGERREENPLFSISSGWLVWHRCADNLSITPDCVSSLHILFTFRLVPPPLFLSFPSAPRHFLLPPQPFLSSSSPSASLFTLSTFQSPPFVTPPVLCRPI